MAILDGDIMEKILLLTCSILEKNFFYEPEEITKFLDVFTEDSVMELEEFEAFAEPRTLVELELNPKARLYFTCYFVSAQLRYVFINFMHFTEQELKAFENFLPSDTGDNSHDKQQSPEPERANYRKFFK
jgi:hypothetical protein